MAKPKPTPLKFDEVLGKVEFKDLHHRGPGFMTYLFLLMLAVAIGIALYKFLPRVLHHPAPVEKEEYTPTMPVIPGIDVEAPPPDEDDGE